MSYEEDVLGEITSLVSVPITNCNVPDPRSVDAEFVYNFYVDGEDRQYNSDPISPIPSDMGLIDRETVDRIEARERGALSARVPRFIRISVSPYLNEIEALSEGEVSNDILQTLRTAVGNSRAYSAESEIENSYGARLTTVDSGARRRVQSEIYRIAESLIDSNRQSDKYSDQTLAMTLNEIFSDDIDASIMMDALSDNRLKGYQFVNQISGKRYSRFDLRESVDILSKVNAEGYRSVTTQQVTSNPLSTNFLVDLLGSSADDGERNWVLDDSVFGAFSGFNDAELESLQPNLRALDVSEERYSESREALVSLDYPTIKHAGYIVEKLATSPEGLQERFSDLIVLNPNVTEFIDPVVKYGFTYTYRARQLFIVKTLQVESISESGSEYRYRIVTSAIASSSPPPATVRAVETTPPNPPGTLICSFIYKTGNGIRLDWSRPSNPTRDIRKYQVFRRKGFLDPYQLIAEYDFTDPLYSQFEQREMVDPSLVIRSPVPVYSHTDREFGRESSYMYCVASVDAHGLTSGYGTQVQASFDRFSNSLSIKTVSQSGAPKAYPNYYIDPTVLEEFGSDRLVEDVIKDSGHGRMRLYFNPDAYRVASDEDGTETQPIVLSSDRGVYKFQIINLDRQESRVLTVNINKDSSLGDLI
jgi:hypothetical protein